MKINRTGNLIIAEKGYEVTIDDLGSHSIIVTSYEPFDLSRFREEDVENSKSLSASFKEGWLLDYKEGMDLPEPPKEIKRGIKKIPKAEDVGAFTRANIKITKEKKTAHSTPAYKYESKIDKSVFEKIEQGKVASRQAKIEDQERILKAVKEDEEINASISRGSKEIPTPKDFRVNGKRVEKDYQLPKTEVRTKPMAEK